MVKAVKEMCFFASNPSGQIAAIKLIKLWMMKICKNWTAAAERFENIRWILRVIDIIYTKNEKFLSTMAFDSIAIVLTPVPRETLANWVGSRSKG